ncbi:MAG: N-acetylmuramoyl-L-alanine amidase [Bacillota bacterium]
MIKEAVVNLRAAPTTASSIVGKAGQGESLEVLGKQGDWYRVKKNGVTCWVAGWLVEIGQAAPPANTGPEPGQTDPANDNKSYVVEVTGDNVNIRSGPGTSHTIIGRAGSGAKYSLLDKSGNWYKISINGGSGWIYGQFAKVSVDTVSRGPAGGTGWAVINGSNVNIRSGPGTGYSVVSRANRGERLLLADKSSDWYKVVLDSGGTGWVVSWLVEVDNDREAEPGAGSVVPQPPAGGDSKPAGGNTGSSGQGNVLPPPRAPENGAESGQEHKLKALTTRMEGGNTIITVQSDGTPIKYAVSSLNDPDRLIIDIEGLEPGPVPESTRLSSPLASMIRVGWYGRDPNVTRIVVDLKSGIRYEKQLSPGADQLKIVLMPRVGRTLKGVKIVLDPGHGGSDPGAIGPTGLKEKDVNLDIARKTAQYLSKMGAEVILTRTGDSYVDLYERPNVAGKNGAALYVSIHSNANPRSAMNGTSTYFLRTPDEGMDHVRFEGMYLARCIQSDLVGVLGRVDRGVLQANYVVLTKSRVPAALVEVAYLSNPEEEKLLGNEAFRNRAALAIAQGIADYMACK